MPGLNAKMQETLLAQSWTLVGLGLRSPLSSATFSYHWCSACRSIARKSSAITSVFKFGHFLFFIHPENAYRRDMVVR